MLAKLFVSILNMSLVGSYAIVFVLLARLLFKKAPKIFSYALWGTVLFRLLCPFSFESVVSLIPTGEISIPQDIIYSPAPQTSAGVTAVDHMVNPMLPVANSISDSVNPIHIWLFIGAVIWSLGILAMLIYSIVAFAKLKRSLIGAAHLKENIYLADHIASPFVMGLLKPKIYLPSLLSDSEKDFVIAHELCHLKRFDHATRILGFAALVVHWFNPLVWIAFIASGKDMELSADEAVMKKMDRDIRTEYSQSLLRFGTEKRMIHATPLAFGEGDTKSRVKNVLNYKKPAFWVVVIAVIAVVGIGVGLMANPKSNPILPPQSNGSTDTESATELWARRPMIMVDSVLYLDTGKEIVGNVDDSAILGQITSAVEVWELPTEHGQCNFDSGVGAKYAAYEEGMVVFLNNKWFFFEKDVDDTIVPEYTITKYDKTGAVLAGPTLKSQELAQAIIMDSLVKSAAWEGMDISSLEEYYLIRQTFAESQETHDYYAYLLANGTSALKPGTPVLQSGTNGRYTSLSVELYDQLVASFGSGQNLFFWVKPDEPPQVIGNTAAEIWLKSFMNENTPAEKRISNYTITDVKVIVGEPKAGVKWEDMAYQYVVQLTYDITTATEQYLAAGDGVSGKGSFEGLFRELCVKVKSDNGGGFQIVAVGTGGGEQEFANKSK